MTIWVVHDVGDGRLHSAAEDERNIAPDAELTKRGRAKAGPFAGFVKDIGNTLEWNTTTLVFDAVTPLKRRSSTEEFYAKFTADEFEAMVGAARIDNKVQALLGSVDLLDRFDPNDTDTIARVNHLETVGVIGAGRAAQILA